MPSYLVDMPREEMTDVVAVNVNSTLQVTYAVLPGMVQKYVVHKSCIRQVILTKPQTENGG